MPMPPYSVVEHGQGKAMLEARSSHSLVIVSLGISHFTASKIYLLEHHEGQIPDL